MVFNQAIAIHKGKSENYFLTTEFANYCKKLHEQYTQTILEKIHPDLTKNKLKY